MLLKVGELAQRAGLTVRALHHYDAIGLLTPSARSASGYRLYNGDDIARLHAIQALRQLGFSLAEIGAMLAADGSSLPAIVARQIRALDHEIARARELRARLRLLESSIEAGEPPAMSDWLATLDLMATYRKYFTPAELRRIFRNWKKTQAEWRPLIADVAAARARGARPDSEEAQQLAQRWMDLSIRWMQGDIDLLKRWGEMHRLEPAANSRNGVEPALLRYIDKAVELRMTVFHRHLTPDEMTRMNKGLSTEWSALNRRVMRLVTAGVRPESDKARALLAEWEALLDKMTGHDPVIRAKLRQAYRREPLLRKGHVIAPQAREFIDRVRAAINDA